MTEMKSDFLRVMNERGYIHQCTDNEGLDAYASEKKVVCYVGYDCTADSLHVGSLVSIMMLRWLQKCGHKPIVLMGGGTTRIGDPTGRDDARPVLTDDIIAGNMAGIRKIFEKFLTFGDGPTDAIMVNNADWLDCINYISFLRDFGRHFSVNRMLSFDSVKIRLEREQSLSFLEFNYMILQAYDFVELARKYGCVLQMGGSDQWGNIVNGVELGRRVDDAALFGLTTPLITTASGGKMGKTASGAIWLNEERLSAYDYYQFWRNTEDADVIKFMKLFTELPMEQIAEYAKFEGAAINDAKKILAFEAVKLCRGEEAALTAAETARKTFEEGVLADSLPTVEIARADLDDGIPAFDLFRRADLAKTGGEARRLVKGGGAKINDEKVDDENQVITAAAIDSTGVIKLSAGKKRHVLIRPV
ncbi:tyrosine--tRNA ligase [Thalassospira sp. MCCC 1A01428]|uniref:tyrosine--tRNA ligase n=1 Tax=Thalassospira sp. MCCC 1A01428 TaxID=1470575 RepID=UPI000A1F7403|nr:tyrosine--tRNA ligase [Thalassospira sp. MCCC 1A01428]OSQ40253.1 tyrosyl-tRNA synthetase [Thalassospira sp. MCCC 1A01428]